MHRFGLALLAIFCGLWSACGSDSVSTTSQTNSITKSEFAATPLTLHQETTYPVNFDIQFEQVFHNVMLQTNGTVHNAFRIFLAFSGNLDRSTACRLFQRNSFRILGNPINSPLGRVNLTPVGSCTVLNDFEIVFATHWVVAGDVITPWDLVIVDSENVIYDTIRTIPAKGGPHQLTPEEVEWQR